jgi:2-polyprenyl-3-methyl-5-hydroxy-6-metoxy-1,4-benzoquinol methylase
MEWDALATERREQIDDGLDLSLSTVVLPVLLELARPVTGRVLDVGCGVGTVTQRLSAGADEVVAIDPSSRSVAVARSHFTDPRVEYRVASVEQLALERPQPFDLVVANMTLMGVPDLDPAVGAIATLLGKGGRGVFSITHPWWWPVYWEYSDLDWFHYSSEIFIEAEFSISSARTTHITTHVHRPLEAYVEALRRHGLSMRALFEPIPSDQDMGAFPTPWRFPRFLLASFSHA